MKRLVATITKDSLEKMLKDTLQEVCTPNGDILLLRLDAGAKQMLQDARQSRDLFNGSMFDPFGAGRKPQ